MSKGIATLDLLDKQSNTEDLSGIIGRQVGELNKLSEKVKDAMNAAEDASKLAEKAKTDARFLFGDKKKAIEELQESNKGLANAVHAAAVAQKISFEFQSQLAEISKALFDLGTKDIAATRLVIIQIENKMKYASRGELTDLARQELSGLLEQLKEKEDIHNKQEKFSEKLKIQDENDRKLEESDRILADNDRKLEESDRKLADNDRKLEESDRKLADNDRRLEENDRKLADNDRRLEENDRKLADNDRRLEDNDRRLEEKLKMQAEIDKLQGEQLKIHEETDKRIEQQLKMQSEIDQMHSEQLKAHEETDKRFEEQLQKQAEIDRLHDEQLGDLQKKNNELDVKLNGNIETIEVQEKKLDNLEAEIKSLKTALDSKTNNSFTSITLAVASSALVISLIHLFIR